MHITLQSICPVLMIAFFLYKKVKRSNRLSAFEAPLALYKNDFVFIAGRRSGVFQHHTPGFIRPSDIRNFLRLASYPFCQTEPFF